MRMILILGAGVLAVSAVTPVSAADLAVQRMVTKARPLQPAPVSPVYNWTGFYIGGNVGYGWSHRDFTNTITGTLGSIQNRATNIASDNGNGWLGGGQIGFNYQLLSRLVAGVEADIDASHITSSTSACFSSLVAITACGTRDTDIKDFGTLRGRLGYAFDKLLVYGTGGWAWGRGTNTTQINCIGPGCPGTSGVPPTSPAPASVDINPSGWVAGGGLEWAFLPNWTLRAEYLHLQFDGVTEDRSKAGFFPSLVITSHVSSNTGIDIVRFGVTYLFNWSSPPVATY
jgi:outer membrane immunogenic protein